MSARTLPLALVLAGLAAGFTHAALTTDVPPACHTVDVGEDSNATAHDVQELLSRGYAGRAGDGAERLYAPECAR